MSRKEKIKKLANAVRRWRGLAYYGKFIHPPQTAAAQDVVRWLNALGHPLEIIKAEVQLIANFKKIEDFESWIRELETPTPSPLSTAAVMGGAA